MPIIEVWHRYYLYLWTDWACCQSISQPRTPSPSLTPALERHTNSVLTTGSSNPLIFPNCPSREKSSGAMTPDTWTPLPAHPQSAISMEIKASYNIEDILSKLWLRSVISLKLPISLSGVSCPLRRNSHHSPRRSWSIPLSMRIFYKWWTPSDMMLTQWACFAVPLLLSQPCIPNKTPVWLEKESTKTRKSATNRSIDFWAVFQP